jgi:tripartite-type tricarboxylate transporter receptor subunit TctC
MLQSRPGAREREEFSTMVSSRIAVALFMAVFAGTVAAQRYPTQPIKVFVTASGAPDLISRVLGEKVGPALGQPVVVEARLGGSGSVAGELVARATPDGHTLVLCTDAMMTITPHVLTKLSFDPNKDFVPVATVASSELFLAVGPEQPFKTVQELIEHAKKARPPLAYGSNGMGGQHHLTMEMFKAHAGIDLLQSPTREPLRPPLRRSAARWRHCFPAAPPGR